MPRSHDADGDGNGLALPDKVPGHILAYVRVSTNKQIISPEAQRSAIEAAVRRQGLDPDRILWFQDAPVELPDGSYADGISAKVPLDERPAGRELCRSANRGDLVVIAKTDRAFRSLSDCVLLLDRWERQGVGLMLCDFPGLSDLASPFGKAIVQIVAIFAEIERKLISIRTREGLAARKRVKRAINQYSGYGFIHEKRWDRQAGKYVKFQVPHPAERAAMQQIVRWRMEGFTWESIYWHMRKEGILTKDGKEWSCNRLLRGFRAELEHHARENGGKLGLSPGHDQGPKV